MKVINTVESHIAYKRLVDYVRVECVRGADAIDCVHQVPRIPAT